MGLLSIFNSWKLTIVNYANVWTEFEKFTEISWAILLCYTTVKKTGSVLREQIAEKDTFCNVENILGIILARRDLMSISWNGISFS